MSERPGSPGVFGALVGAEDQDRLRIAGLDRVELVLPTSGIGLSSAATSLEEEQEDDRNGGRGRDHDQDRGGQEAPPERRRLVVLDVRRRPERREAARSGAGPPSSTEAGVRGASGVGPDDRVLGGRGVDGASGSASSVVPPRRPRRRRSSASSRRRGSVLLAGLVVIALRLGLGGSAVPRSAARPGASGSPPPAARASSCAPTPRPPRTPPRRPTRRSRDRLRAAPRTRSSRSRRSGPRRATRPHGWISLLEPGELLGQARGALVGSSSSPSGLVLVAGVVGPLLVAIALVLAHDDAAVHRGGQARGRSRRACAGRRRARRSTPIPRGRGGRRRPGRTRPPGCRCG